MQAFQYLTKRSRRKRLLMMAGVFCLGAFSAGWIIGTDPETGRIKISLSGDESLNGKVLAFVSEDFDRPDLLDGESATAADESGAALAGDESEEQSDTTQSNSTKEASTATTSRGSSSNTTQKTTTTKSSSNGATTTKSTSGNSIGSTTTTAQQTTTTEEQTTTTINIYENGRSPNGFESEDWDLIRWDDFSGSNLNGSYWEQGFFSDPPVDGGWDPAMSSLESNCYHRDLVTLENGFLKLTAIDLPFQLQQFCQLKGGVNGEVASGIINSRERFKVHPGTYMEARVKVPTNNGEYVNWSHLFLSEIGNWPDGGSIAPFSTYLGPACADFGWGTNGVEDQYLLGCGDVKTSWFTIGMMWEDDGKVDVYYDGTLIGSVDTAAKAGSQALTYGMNVVIAMRVPQPDRPNYLFPEPSQSMFVDYIDFYEIS